MFHPDTQFLIDHWTALAGCDGVRGGVPDRAALEPHRLGVRLPRVFVAERSGADARLRLAGSWLESFHDGALRDRALTSLWSAGSRPMIEAALDQVFRGARPVVVSALAGTAPSPIEVALVPMRSGPGRPDRVLGLYAPTGPLALARDAPRTLTARLSITVGDPARPVISLATVRGRRIA